MVNELKVKTKKKLWVRLKKRRKKKNVETKRGGSGSSEEFAEYGGENT